MSASPNSRSNRPKPTAAERLKELAHLRDSAAGPSLERAREILEDRANEYSRPLALPNSADLVELVFFVLGGETFAVESAHVAALFPLTDLALLPGVDPPVVGILVWRGELLNVADIRKGTDRSAPATNDGDHVLVLSTRDAVLGILVDEIQELMHLSASTIRPLGETFAPEAAYATAMTADGVLVLDVPKLLASFS